MHRMAGAVTIGLVVAGCTNDPGFTGVPDVREAMAAEVTQCRYVSDITGTPSVYGPILGPEGLKYTRNQVKDEARKAGANTVVFDLVPPGAELYQLHAKVYAC